MIEQVKIKKTLKAGKTVWEEGRVLNSPLPRAILEEVTLGTGTVQVLKEGKEIFKSSEVKWSAKGTNTTTVTKTFVPEPPKIFESKPVFKESKFKESKPESKGLKRKRK